MDRLPLDYRLAHNEQIETERKAWHQRKREESDEWREAYEFMEAQEKQLGDQMAEVMRIMNSVTSQMVQGIGLQPLKQEPEPVMPQPLRQQPDIFGTIANPLSFGVLAMMFIDPEAMQKAVRRMALCKEIFETDEQFRRRMYPVSGWEV